MITRPSTGGTFSYDQSDRVAICDGEGQDGHYQRAGIEGSRDSNDLQALRSSRREVAKAKRLPTGCSGESGGQIRKWRVGRKK